MSTGIVLLALVVLVLVTGGLCQGCPPCFTTGALGCVDKTSVGLFQLPCPCLNWGTCKCYWYMLAGVHEKWACDCPRPYYGDSCQYLGPLTTPAPPPPPSACADNTDCGGYGTCVAGVCHCVSWRTGPQCQNSINGNPCSSYPCQNGGGCSHQWGGSYYVYQCACPTGTVQPTCTTSTSAYCTGTTNPCQKGGTCVEDTSPAGYHCDCVCFVGGQHCDVAISALSLPMNPCSNSPCQNGGTCCCTGYGYKCTCHAGFFSGQNCEVYIGPGPSAAVACPAPPACAPGAGVCPPTCTPVPDAPCASASFTGCENGGSCVDVSGAATCICPCLTYGDRCQFPGLGLPFAVNPCEARPCPVDQSCCCRGFVATCAPP